MKFSVITLFPEVIKPYLEGSIIGRAIKNKHISVKVFNLRDFIKGKHRKADDRAYGGGPGMVMYAEPVVAAVRAAMRGVKNKNKAAIVFMDAGGKEFTDKVSADFAEKYERIVLVCGHYEGIDERAPKIIKDLGYQLIKLSIGPYVLTGGELPALVVIDSVSRKISGVLGKSESLEENRLGVGVPQYTRPEVIKAGKKKYAVPKVLMSGHHAKIEEWRSSNRK